MSKPSQRRLAAAVGPDESDALTGIDPQLHVADDRLASVKPKRGPWRSMTGRPVDAVAGADSVGRARGAAVVTSRPAIRRSTAAGNQIPASRSRAAERRADLGGRPDVDRTAVAIEREDQVGHRPGRLDEVLDEDDGGRPLGAQAPPGDP